MMVVVAKSATAKKSAAVKQASKSRIPLRDDGALSECKKKEKTESVGSKIHAQRKFAQGAPTLPGSFNSVKFAKESKKKRPEKRPESPLFLPVKRPKTEDFLTFLCFRDTSVLSPSLACFNFAPTAEADEDDTILGDDNESNTEPLVKNGNSTNSAKEETPRPSSTTKPNPSSKTKDTVLLNSVAQSEGANGSGKSSTLKKIPDVMVVVKQAEKAVAAFKKGAKESPAVTNSPQLNEQDAKFAMTALKLKYQKQRMAKPAPVVSVVSKIARKGRTVMLTRSKSKNVESEVTKLSQMKKALTLKSDSKVQSRNAPSPDIIFGVSHTKQPKKAHVQPKVSEESESVSASDANAESEDDNSGEDSSSSASSADVPTTRSLRNGKELLSVPKKKEPAKTDFKNNKSGGKKVSTRSAHRLSTSPLRELPMYTQKKKGKPKKVAKNTKAVDEKQRDLTSSTTRRPTRKTKETASIYLGLINRFSSDEDNSSDQQEDEDDSTGSSSSSEAKFLEKKYNESIKRDEQSKVLRKTSKKPAKNANSKTIAKNDKQQLKPDTAKATKAKSEQKTAKRILRSTSRDKTPTPPRRIATRRMSLPLPLPEKRTEGAARKSATVYPRRHDIYRSSSSDDSSSESESSSVSGKESTHSEKKTISNVSKTAIKSAKVLPPKAPAKVNLKGEAAKAPSKKNQEVRCDSRIRSQKGKIKSDTTDEDNDDSCEDSEGSSRGSSKKIIIEIQREGSSKANTSSEASSDNDLPNENDKEDSCVSADEESKEVVITKASIAVQVDLDTEDVSYGTQAETTGESSNPTLPPKPPRTPTPPLTTTPSVATIPASITNFISSVNISNSQIPYMPSFSSPNPAFYPALHLTPPVVNNIQFLARGTQEFSFTTPGIAMNIPATVPFSRLNTPLLQPNTMCFSSTSISAATTLQTHIRSVAANLDIPLVRPVVGAENPLNLPFANAALMMRNAGMSRPPLTRPVAVWSNDSKPHTSAFRVPTPGIRLVKPGASNSSNMFLPLSVVQQQNQSAQHHHFHNRDKISVASTEATNHGNLHSIGVGVGTSTASGSTSRTNTAQVPVTTPGYSIIQSLPNVSIVPKFDRNSKPVVHPIDQKALERKIKKSNIEAKNKVNTAATVANEEVKVLKEKGSKKKKVFSLPQSTSPLTVKKETTTPVTYAGVTSKKCQKTSKEESSGKTVRKTPDPFIKLLQMKKNVSSPASCSKASDSKSDVLQNTEPVSQPLNPKEVGKTEKSSKGNRDEKQSSTVNEKKDHSIVQEIPTFHPSDDQFQDPLKYMEEIRAEAEVFGMAKIVPPKSFRPDCNVDDDMRFTAYNHYIHKMHQRWGPNVHETQAMKDHLRKSNIDISSVPMIGGMEVDLCTLFHTVQSLGGLREIIEKQKWNRVADAMHIPKAANDRALKLDTVYMKYVLPYETLSEAERKRLLNKVEKNWNARQERLKKKVESGDSAEESDDDPLEEVDDCIMKGKTTPLSAYYRVARNTRTMLFPNKEPTIEEVEDEYWNSVRQRTKHVCVYSGSIDCMGAAGVGWGFPLPKPANKHPWNLKVLANNPGSILRSMGPVMGATVPTLHVGMVFTTYCWYRDPHGLPWVEYLHSGGEKIWYVIPASEENKFRNVVKKLMPLQCRNKKIWLASDSVMIPPEVLTQHGISLARIVQHPGEFVVVFPKSYTSAICTSYLVSESVCFAPNEWLLSASEIFADIRASKEPPVFPVEKLLLSILQDQKMSFEILKIVLPQSETMLKDEFTFRKKLMQMGVQTGKLGVKQENEKSHTKKKKQEDEVLQCDTCNYILFLSMVEVRGSTFCLPHALEYLHKHKSHAKAAMMRYDRSQEDLIAILKEITHRLAPSHGSTK